MDDYDAHDAYVEATTDWERVRFHGGLVSAADLRGPCKRLGCTCKWSVAPAGTEVIARGLPGTVVAYPADWQPFAGWVPVQYRTGLSLTRLDDIVPA